MLRLSFPPPNPEINKERNTGKTRDRCLAQGVLIDWRPNRTQFDKNKLRSEMLVRFLQLSRSQQ